MSKRTLSRLLACAGYAIVCLGPAGSVAETQCTCRYAGQSYALGACVCIDLPVGGRQFACCGMVLNNTSWKFSDEGCPMAATEPAGPAQTSTVSGDEFNVAPKARLPQSVRQQPQPVERLAAPQATP